MKIKKQVLDNHVVDYVPPEVLVQKNERLKRSSLNGKFGMAIVGAISSDPRLVSHYHIFSLWLNLQFILPNVVFKYTKQYLELFANSGVPPKRKLTKFMISENAVVQVDI